MLVCGPNAGNVVLVHCQLEKGNFLNEWTREERCVAIQLEPVNIHRLWWLCVMQM